MPPAAAIPAAIVGGSLLSGIAGGRDRTATQTSTGDPAVAAMNQLIFDEVSGALRGAGGLPGVTAFRPNAVPQGQELALLNQMANLSAGPIAGLPGAVSAAPGAAIGQTGSDILRRMLGDVQGQFSQFVVPGVRNALTASGFTPGSGAVAEAIANAAQQFTLPFAQQAYSMAPGALLLPGQIAGQDVQNRLGQLSGLQTGVAAAGAPRLAQLAEESTLRDVLLSYFGRPISPSGAGTVTTTQQGDFLGGLLGGLGTGLSAYGMVRGMPRGT